MTHAIRLPAHNRPARDIAQLLTRPVGRPGQQPVVWDKSFRPQAASREKARRVVAKVAHHRGALFPRVGCIITRVSPPSRAVVRFYNKRGTAEQWIKGGKQAVKMTRLSCHRNVFAGISPRIIAIPFRTARWSLHGGRRDGAFRIPARTPP